MVSIQVKAQCILWYNSTNSAEEVIQKYRDNYGQDPPDVESIERWYSNFQEFGRADEWGLATGVIKVDFAIFGLHNFVLILSPKHPTSGKFTVLQPKTVRK